MTNDGRPAAGLILSARASHLYPGARGTVQGDATEGGCAAEFADGSMAFGTLTRGEDGGWMLELGPYTTARGTEIPAKRWRLALTGAGAREFRIAARLKSPCE
ncbi:MAG TPA: hypothetical protein VLA52_07300 [Thermohalobaculum sp.]|nr:hypothetical protein [Thermohalobaculum sp.]